MLFSETQLDFKILKPDEINSEVYSSQQLKDLVWDLTQSKLLSTLMFDQSKLKPTSVVTEVLKSSSDLDMQAVNFIVNCLLSNSVDHSSTTQNDFEQQLIHLIDLGCQQLVQSGGDSLSKYCMNNLFELCKQQEWPSSHEHIRKRIAHLATPILVNRCKITLRKYISDELKMGANSLPKNRM